MNDVIALERLNALLPLKQRQDSLSAKRKRIHQRILRSLALEGVAPTLKQLARRVGVSDGLEDALQSLVAQDLIVLSKSGTAVAGAYPMTTEETPHKVNISSRSIYAMCALDAVSIAPMFDVAVTIHSVCRVTGRSIEIQQDAKGLLNAQPSREVKVGIRWQQPGGCAAHSLCTEMVFLKDSVTAGQWQNGDDENISVLSLDEAISVGKRFFKPLLQD